MQLGIISVVLVFVLASTVVIVLAFTIGAYLQEGLNASDIQDELKHLSRGING